MEQLFKIGINNQWNVCSSQLNNPYVEENHGDIIQFCDFCVQQHIEYTENEPVVKQKNTVRNIGKEKLKINRFSSVYLNDVVMDFQDKDVMLHFCHFAWEGEGQWVAKSLYEFGIYPVADHLAGRNSRSLNSIGSWSTEKYYPLLLIENKTDAKTWFFEHLGGMSWEIELGTFGRHNHCSLTVEVNALNENQSNTYIELTEGQEFTTASVLYGNVDGDVNEALRTLLKYKRSKGLTLEELPVCFNDYMNCLWARPSEEKLLPLIDAAAEVGAEIFCIDDGWFINENEGIAFGDWIEDDTKFGEYGFQGIIKYIQEKGLKPGIWFELETCTSNSTIFNLSSDAALYRGSKTVEEYRCFVNFRCKEATDYLLERIRYFYQCGIRYIKNDYNHSLGIGCDNNNLSSTGLGIVENTRAFYQFIDRVTKEMPDLVIENCGSGAMRCDFGTLEHFHLQSVSDQEHYLNNPSILYGVQKCILPEKCGIWAYPYPLIFDNRDSVDYLCDEEYQKSMMDGEQTIYNMALVMFGVPILSGHIEKSDSYNRSLIAKAIEVYKAKRQFLMTALPITVYPQQKLYHEGYSVIALLNEEKIRLGIFKNHGADNISIDLSHWCRDNSSLEEIYPMCDEQTKAGVANGIFTFKCEKSIAARVYEIYLK